MRRPRHRRAGHRSDDPSRLPRRDRGSGRRPADDVPFVDPDEIAILLFTSGTTGEPKAAVLRHRHLASYIIGSVEFIGADEDEAQLVSVPPYHIAGDLGRAVSSLYSGRRVVYLPAFDPAAWVDAGRRHERSPTPWSCRRCCGRILDAIERDAAPACRRCATSPTAAAACRSR